MAGDVLWVATSVADPRRGGYSVLNLGLTSTVPKSAQEPQSYYPYRIESPVHPLKHLVVLRLFLDPFAEDLSLGPSSVAAQAALEVQRPVHPLADRLLPKGQAEKIFLAKEAEALW